MRTAYGRRSAVASLGRYQERSRRQWSGPASNEAPHPEYEPDEEQERAAVIVTPSSTVPGVFIVGTLEAIAAAEAELRRRFNEKGST